MSRSKPPRSKPKPLTFAEQQSIDVAVSRGETNRTIKRALARGDQKVMPCAGKRTRRGLKWNDASRQCIEEARKRVQLRLARHYRIPIECRVSAVALGRFIERRGSFA